MSTLKATNIKNESSASNNIVLDSGGGVVVSGILTATTFSGDGSSLIGIDATQIVTGNTSVQTVDTGSDGHVKINTEGTERARIDSSGRLLIGIGTARTNIDFYSTLLTPTSQIEGTSNNTSSVALISNSSTDNVSSQLHFCKSGTDGVGNNGAVVNNEILGRISFSGNDGTNFLSGAEIVCAVDGTPGTNDMPSRLSFRTTSDSASSSTERMRIKDSGLTSLISTAGCFDVGTTQIAGTSYWLFAGRYSSTVGSPFTGTISIVINSNGNVQNTNNSYGAISDIKLKENIVDASSQWDDLKALQVRNYNFKEGQTHTQIGLIAQEVELVSPGLVSESPDSDEDGNDLGTVTKSVNYSVLYMKAVKALQEAMERIETLEAQNAAILARLDAAGI